MRSHNLQMKLNQISSNLKSGLVWLDASNFSLFSQLIEIIKSLYSIPDRNFLHQRKLKNTAIKIPKRGSVENVRAPMRVICWELSFKFLCFYHLFILLHFISYFLRWNCFIILMACIMWLIKLFLIFKVSQLTMT